MTDSRALTTEERSKLLLGEICRGVSEVIAQQIEQALPKGITKDRFIRTALQGIQTHRDKNKLATADRNSFYMAVQRAASDGLLLDGREASLVVFGVKQKDGTYKDEVQYMPMVQGLVKLARNSGEIKNIEAAVVYKNDTFTYVMGSGEPPRHEADWFSDDRGEPVGAWALVTLTSGEKIPAMLSKHKIMRVARRTKNDYQYDPNKGDAWEEWWKKTAVKNVLKYVPRSTELDRAMAVDDVQDGEEQVATEVPEEAPRQEPKKRRADVVKEAASPVIDAEVITEPEPIKQTTDNEELPI